MELTDFEGRVAWVVGASGTIGAATAALLAKRRATTVVSARDISRLTALTEGEACIASAIAVDIKNNEAVRTAASTIEAKHGKVDLLVMSVAVPAFGEFLTLADDAFEDALQTKYMGSIRCIRAVLPGMIRRRFGRIVVLSGGGGTHPRPVHLPGGGANAALELVARGLAMRYAKDGVRINIVAPGPIASPRMDQIVAASSTAGQADSDRPVGMPNDVAEAIAYLLSSRSEFVNGAVLRLDGGVPR